MTRAFRPAVLILLACAAAGVFIAAYARLWPYVLDDSYISLRYARNLALGHGLVYNVGERVEGYTNFLWTVGLAVPHLVHADPVLAIKIANLLLVLGTALALYRLGRVSLFAPEALPPAGAIGRRATSGAARKRLRPVGAGGARPAESSSGPSEDWLSPSALATVPALLFLATPQVAVSAAEGLETMLFCFLLVLSAAWFFEEHEPGRFPRSALSLAALAMTRPDGVVFGVFLLACAALLSRPRPYLVRFAALFFGVFVTYFTLCWLYYGHPLPNTFYAKGGGTPGSFSNGWGEVRRFVSVYGGWAWLAILPVLVSRRSRRAAWLLAGILALRIGFEIWSGGPWLGRFRFLVPTIPFIDLLIVAGVATVGRSSLARVAAIAIAATLLLTPGWLVYPRIESQCLGYAQGLQRAQISHGREVRARTGPAAVLAMDDAGAGPYLSERTNIDMLGLNDEHVAHLPGRFSIKADPAYVLARAPDLIVLASRVPEPTDPNHFRLYGHGLLFLDPEFRARYRPVRRYEFDPGYYLVVCRRLDSTQVPADF